MYKEVYESILKYRKEKLLFKTEKDGSIHTHHVNQRYNGGSNEENNLVNLTIREHKIVHWLLWKIEGNINDLFACNRLGGSQPLTEEARLKLSKVNKERWLNYSEEEKQTIINRISIYGVNKMPTSAKLKLSETKKAKGHWKGVNNPFYGSSRNNESNPMFGKKHKEKSKNKMSEAKLNNKEHIEKLIERNKKNPLKGSKNGRAKKVTIDGIEYDTIKSAAEALNVDRSTIRKKLKKLNKI